MRRNELDYFLGSLLDFDKNVSDIIITVGRPLQVEVHGQLHTVPVNPFMESLTPFQTEMIALNLIGGSRRLTEALLKSGSCDSAYSLGDRARFRVNVFSQRGSFSIVLRKLQAEIPKFAELNLHEVMNGAIKEKTGLVLVTGATGSGKTTTLASLIDQLNATQPIHIITLEDPVEFIYEQKKATINQRELGTDYDSFPNGLRAALRQAPKVILVGEMRDRHTVEIALNAAETGHLVFSTLHTIDAGQTINRILGMFEQDEQEQVRLRLADTLRWIFSQRLIPKVGGGRFPLVEIMGANMRTKESIVLGESEGKSFYEIIEANYTFGWRTFDSSCLEAYKHGIITEETALAYCSKRGVVSRGIDQLRKSRGEMVSNNNDLRMASLEGGDRPGAGGGHGNGGGNGGGVSLGGPKPASAKPPPPLPGNLKLKM